MLRLVKFPYLKYALAWGRLILHIINKLADEQLHDPILVDGKDGKPAVLGCSCDRVFWMRDDVVDAVARMRRQTECLRDSR